MGVAGGGRRPIVGGHSGSMGHIRCNKSLALLLASVSSECFTPPLLLSPTPSPGSAPPANRVPNHHQMSFCCPSPDSYESTGFSPQIWSPRNTSVSHRGTKLQTLNILSLKWSQDRMVGVGECSEEHLSAAPPQPPGRLRVARGGFSQQGPQDSELPACEIPLPTCGPGMAGKTLGRGWTGRSKGTQVKSPARKRVGDGADAI